MVVSNIPPRYTTEMLLEEWPIEGVYDFLFLPSNGSQNRNAGYAFINFVNEPAALAFCALWKGKRLAHFASKVRKPLWISPSQLQGHSNHLDALHRKTPAKARRGAFQPVIFDPSSGRKTTLEEALAEIHHSVVE
jgi:hypothetical protein